MDGFTFLLFALTAVAGAVFFGYPLGLRLGHRDGFKLGERYGRAEAGADEHRTQVELIQAITKGIARSVGDTDVLTADTLEDSK